MGALCENQLPAASTSVSTPSAVSPAFLNKAHNLLRNPDLRQRTAQFLENAAPAFRSLLPGSTEPVLLTQALYDEASALVSDIAGAGSQRLHDKTVQTWEALALEKHVGEMAAEIWEEMQPATVFLPNVRKGK